MALLSHRWAYLVGATLVTWGAYYSWEKQKDSFIREKRLPAIEKALAIQVNQTSESLLCTETPAFPTGKGFPKTQWVRQPNGMSACQAVFSHSYRDDCKDCDTLKDIGLLTKSDESFTDANGSPASTAVYRLTETGKSLYLSDIHNRKPGHESGCTPGEVKYVGPENMPDEATRPGFCFGGSLRLKPITEYLAPAKFGSQIMMSVRYQIEAVDPAPQLFDSRLKPLLHELPKQGKPALYDPAITTALYAPDGQTVADFDAGSRYGEWIGKK